MSKQLLIYITIFSSIALCSFIFNRWIEGIAFCISHFCIRKEFDRQFHFNKMAYCFILTEVIIWFAIPITLSISISLLSSIPVAFIICLVGYWAADRIDLINYTKRLEAEINQLIADTLDIKKINLYKMTKEDLVQFCASQGLSETQINILCLRVYDHLRISEICEYCHYGRTTVKYHLSQIREKLNLKSI